MRDYIKPFIEDEEIELEDVIAASNRGEQDILADPNSDDGIDVFFE